MFNQISQDIVIDKLNRYFNSQSIPLKCHDGGICNGLAYVHAQYVLADDEEKFNRIMRCIANGNIESATDSDEINLFITQVFLSFVPEVYNKELSQATAIRALGKPVESIFQVGMVLDDSGWQGLLRDIDLKADEVMVIHSVDHTVSLSIKEGKYVLYDPNYVFGYKAFNNEKELIEELHQHVFCYEDAGLAMRLNIVKNISSQPNPKRDLMALYHHYLPQEKISMTAKVGGRTTNNWLMAIQCNDEASMIYLLKQKPPITPLMFCKAIFNNHVLVLHLLIHQQSVDDQMINDCIKWSLMYGKEGAFNELMRHDAFKSAFKSRFLKTNKALLLEYAAEGGNVELLKYIINQCKQEKTPQHTFLATMNKYNHAEKVVMKATQKGHADCLHLLIDEYKSNKIAISDQTKLNCLMQAIKSNQLYVCLTLINDMPPDDLVHIRIRLNLVEKTNVHILKELKKHGVHFSHKAEAIIAKKEQRSIGLLLLIGIELEKFLDYLTKERDIVVIKNQFFPSTPDDKPVTPIVEKQGRLDETKRQNPDAMP